MLTPFLGIALYSQSTIGAFTRPYDVVADILGEMAKRTGAVGTGGDPTFCTGAGRWDVIELLRAVLFFLVG